MRNRRRVFVRFACAVAVTNDACACVAKLCVWSPTAYTSGIFATFGGRRRERRGGKHVRR